MLRRGGLCFRLRLRLFTLGCGCTLRLGRPRRGCAPRQPAKRFQVFRQFFQDGFSLLRRGGRRFNCKGFRGHSLWLLAPRGLAPRRGAQGLWAEGLRAEGPRALAACSQGACAPVLCAAALRAEGPRARVACPWGACAQAPGAQRPRVGRPFAQAPHARRPWARGPWARGRGAGRPGGHRSGAWGSGGPKAGASSSGCESGLCGPPRLPPEGAAGGLLGVAVGRGGGAISSSAPAANRGSPLQMAAIADSSTSGGCSATCPSRGGG